MNRIKLSGSSMFVMLGLLTAGVQADLNHLVPVPVTLAARTDTFTVPRQVSIWSDGTSSDSNVCWIKKLFDQLHVATPASYDTAIHVSTAAAAQVRLRIIINATLGTEGYVLTVTRDSILIAAQTARGQFYGIQTIRQMLPPQIECGKNIPAPQKLPGCVITDYPRYAHRGTHFDIARHFHNMTYLRQLIDRIVLFKGNILHLHAADDQGWRIQISPPPSATGTTITAYNNLTAFGGQYQVGGACANCFFTQAQVRDSLVKYATERKLTIIPEIDIDRKSVV
jgi:hexosaminidase